MASDPRRLFLDLGANLAWPFAVLTWASGADALGPQWGPAVAMCGPLAHMAWRRFVEKRPSPLGLLMVISIGLNAAAGFIPMGAGWFAVKEAVMSIGIGGLFAASVLRGPGLLGGLLSELTDPVKVRDALGARAGEYERALRRGTIEFGGVLALSGVLSGALASVMVRSPTGSAGFAEELGRYTAWSYGVVNLPVLVASAFVLRRVVAALENTTGKTLEELGA